MAESDIKFTELGDDDGLESSLDCLAAAELLQLEGVGHERVCPNCKQPIPTLTIRPFAFECSHCHIRGDVIELIRACRGGTPEEALAWMQEQCANERPYEIHRDPSSPAGGAGSNGGSGGAAPAARAPVLPPEPLSMPAATTIQIYQEFLAECRSPEDKVAELLQSWGINEETIQSTGLRYFTPEYSFLLDDLEDRYGTSALLEAGLLRKSQQLPQATPLDEEEADDDAPAQDDEDGEGELDERVFMAKSDAVVGSFAEYHEAKAPYLVLPYLWQGKPIYLKAIPLLDGARLQQLKLQQYVGTKPAPPCLFNADCVSQARQVVMVRRELDALMAISQGFPAVAYGFFSHFKAAWATYFRGRQLILVLDQHRESLQHLPQLLELFSFKGVDNVKRLDLPPGKNVGEFLKSALDRAKPLVTPSRVEALAGMGGPANQFIAAIPVSRRRTLVVQRQAVKGQLLLHMRFWQQTGAGQWKAEDNTTFVVPMANLPPLANIIAEVTKGQKLTPLPDWMT